MNKEYNAENKLVLASGATPLTVADAIIRECNDKAWLEDVIYYIGMYIKREYALSAEGEDK